MEGRNLLELQKDRDTL